MMIKGYANLNRGESVHDIFDIEVTFNDDIVSAKKWLARMQKAGFSANIGTINDGLFIAIDD